METPRRTVGDDIAAARPAGNGSIHHGLWEERDGFLPGIFTDFFRENPLNDMIMVTHGYHGFWWNHDHRFFQRKPYPLVICYIANWKDPPKFSIGKSTISTGHFFHSYVKLPEGKWHDHGYPCLPWVWWNHDHIFFQRKPYPLVICYIANWKDPPKFSIGKSTISTGHFFHSYVKLPEGKWHDHGCPCLPWVWWNHDHIFFQRKPYPLVICYIANWKDPPKFSIGKSTISTGHFFHSYVKLPEGKWHDHGYPCLPWVWWNHDHIFFQRKPYPLVICYIANWKDPPKFSIGKSTISTGHFFHSYVKLPEGKWHDHGYPCLPWVLVKSWSQIFSEMSDGLRS